MVPSKVEVTLKKADPVSWGKLEDPKHKPEPETTDDVTTKKADEKPDWYISDDDISESDWEDDDENEGQKTTELDTDGPPMLEEPKLVPPEK